MMLLLLILFPILLGVLCVRSYRDYLRVGPGGFGQHPTGWFQCMFIKFLLLAHRCDNLDCSIFDEEVKEGGDKAKRWLGKMDVPVRKGERSYLLPYPTPQREMVYEKNPELAKEQLDFFMELADQYPKRIVFGCSVIERIGPAIFAHPEVEPQWHLTATRREIMHIHLAPFSYDCCPPPAPSTEILAPGQIAPYTPHAAAPGAQSLHMTLSPLDAKLIIEQGWGVRHAASGKPPYPLASMPAGFVFVYAPRDREELEVMKRLCRASVAFAAQAGPEGKA